MDNIISVFYVRVIRNTYNLLFWLFCFNYSENAKLFHRIVINYQFPLVLFITISEICNSKQANHTVSILNLDDLLLEHAKDMYEMKRKELEKKCGAKDKEFDWELIPKALRKQNLVVTTVSTSYHSRFEPEGLVHHAFPKTDKTVDSSKTDVSAAKEGSDAELSSPKHTSLYRTEYRNTTDREQKYTLVTERTTTQSVHMAFSRCKYSSHLFNGLMSDQIFEYAYDIRDE